MNKHNYPVWLSDKDYSKSLWQIRGQLNDIFFPLRKYGQEIYVDGAIEETMELFETWGKRIRGRDIPVILTKKRNPR